MSAPAGQRLRDIFAARKRQGRGVLVAYVTVGDPSLEQTLAAARQLVQRGVDVIELGVPFSDPVADGPVIQLASERALARGVTLNDVFAVAKKIRQEAPNVGLVLMGYANPFFCFGLRAAAEASADSGVDGWIVPDAPYEEAWRFREHLSAFGVAFVPLLAPTTPIARAAAIVNDLQPPFAYYVSVTGVTGVRAGFEAGWHAPLDALRAEAETPVIVGFGIGDGAAAKAAGQHADGVVVGSALVQRLSQATDAAAIAPFIDELRAAL